MEAGNVGFKVGCTSGDVVQRIAELQGGCPVDLQQRWVIERGRLTEKAIHRFLAAFSMRGEWFSPDAMPIADRCGSDPEFVAFIERFSRTRKWTINRLLPAAGVESVREYILGSVDRPASVLMGELGEAERPPVIIQRQIIVNEQQWAHWQQWCAENDESVASIVRRLMDRQTGWKQPENS